MHVQENVQLAPYTTLHTPATARYLVEAHSLEEVQSAIAFANEHNLSILVLGGGSNVIVSTDIEKVVIVIKLNGYEILTEDTDTVTLRVQAGTNWHEFVTTTVAQGWYGLENLALIPGTVGGAPVQNIGAYGVEVSDYISAVTAINLETNTVVTLSNEECTFAYRHSIFRGDIPNTWVIVSVDFTLNTHFSPVLTYPSLQRKLSEKHIDTSTIDAQTVLDTVVDIRQSKLPDPTVTPNVGSFFKNPIIDAAQYKTLLQDYPDIPSYAVDDNTFKIPASWLIEQIGYKGYMEHGLGFSEKHALVLINPGHQPGTEVLALANTIKTKVAEAFDISLEIEPIVI